MARLVSPACRRLDALERRLRALVLHWLAAMAAIDESREAAGVDDRELARLDEAVRRARESGR